MSWFGLGSSKPVVQPEPAKQSINTIEEEFAPNEGDVTKFQQDLLREHEKVAVQTLLIKLADIGFEKCVKEPSTSLSLKEKTCIKEVVSKYFEATEFVVKQVRS